MRVNLGTIEVNDRLRRAIRQNYGQGGLATRAQVQEQVEAAWSNYVKGALLSLESLEEDGRSANSTWSIVTYYAEDKRTRLDTPLVLSTHRKRRVAEAKLKSKRRGCRPVLLRNDYTGQLYTWTKSTGVSLLPMDT